MLKNFNKLLPYSTSRGILKNVQNLTSQGSCGFGSNAAPKEKVAGGSAFNDEAGAASSSNNNGPPGNNTKNPLKRFLIDKIRLSGPISVAEYMQICVGSPGAGYYSKNDGQIFGARGDFVTSPEFTQMLGELLGVWAVNEFFKLSHSADWQLIELGPGSGSLMHDVLGVARKFRLTEKNMEVRLVETSRQLIGEQATILCGDDDTFDTTNSGTATKHASGDGGGKVAPPVVPPKQTPTQQQQQQQQEINLEKCSKKSLFGPDVYWHDNLSEIPQKFSMILAHEFFDALPVHKFKRVEGKGWREVLIGLDKEKQENLEYQVAHGETVAQKLYLTKKIQESTKLDDLEISPLSAYICSQLADRINQNGGCVLIVDYGSSSNFNDKKTGDTLRGYRHHKIVDPLHYPGRCDVTCDVDFDFLVDTVRDKVAIFGPLDQKTFLLNLGLKVRFEKLLATCQTDEETQYLRRSFELLTDETQMGRRFKVLALFPKVIEDVLKKAPPSGFCPLT